MFVGILVVVGLFFADSRDLRALTACYQTRELCRTAEPDNPLDNCQVQRRIVGTVGIATGLLRCKGTRIEGKESRIAKGKSSSLDCTAMSRGKGQMVQGVQRVQGVRKEVGWLDVGGRWRMEKGMKESRRVVEGSQRQWMVEE